VDISVIALWVGHESPTTTRRYVEADLATNDRAVARPRGPDAKVRRYRAPSRCSNLWSPYDYAKLNDASADQNKLAGAFFLTRQCI